MTPDDFTIRQAVIKDLTSIVEMRKKLKTHMEKNSRHTWGMSNGFVTNLEAYYSTHINNPESKMLVAVHNSTSKIAGMALGKIVINSDYKPDKYGRIDDVWVESEYRLHGICEIMIKELISFYKNKGVINLVLEYAIYNREAKNTWKKMGFQPSLIISTAKTTDLSI